MLPYKGGTNDQPKNRSAVIATAGFFNTFVL
jgi:hypothetical protein